jgi:hypothetical protein
VCTNRRIFVEQSPNNTVFERTFYDPCTFRSRIFYESSQVEHMGNKEAALRIGQVAAQLRVTAYHLRQLCKCSLIEAEQSPGGHYRIPLSEVERLQSEGVPPAPTFIGEQQLEPAAPARAPHPNRLAPPSPAVIGALEDAEIEESAVRRKEATLHKLRLELEQQEVEDQLQARDRRQDAVEAAERQKAAAAQAEQLRRKWRDEWIETALRSLPDGARRETEVEVNGAVEDVLASLQPSQPWYVIQRLVNAAVQKALRPWSRRQEVKRALESAMNKLGWEVRSSSDFVPLKQRAWEAAVAAVGGIRVEAGYSEMETAATQAVQPMIQQYEHASACRRVLSSIRLYGVGSAEREQATQAVRKALAELPIGATQRHIEDAKQAALAPFETAIADHEEVRRLAAEQQRKRSAAQFSLMLQLDHVARYLQETYEWRSHGELVEECDRLRPLIKAALVEELMQRPDMDGQVIRRRIERLCRKL